MAAHYIDALVPIEVKCLSMLLYGPPGIGKTSIAHTAGDVIALDFDRGVQRSFNRRPAMRFDAWPDVEQAWDHIRAHKVVQVDTVGRALDLLSLQLVAENSKWGTRAGGLTIQGYGALGSRFIMWNNALESEGRDRVYLAHEKEKEDGDNRYFRPDIQGRTYTEVHRACDIIGYIFRDRGNKRWIDWNPTDTHLGKNPAAWPMTEVPELGSVRDFVAGLLADAKKKIGQISAESAAVIQLVKEWEGKLAGDPTVDELGAMVVALPNQPPAAYAQLRQVMKLHADKCGLVWNKEEKKFVKRAEAA